MKDTITDHTTAGERTRPRVPLPAPSPEATPIARKLASRIVDEWLETSIGLDTRSRLDALKAHLAAQLEALQATPANAPRLGVRQSSAALASWDTAKVIELIVAQRRLELQRFQCGTNNFDCGDTAVSDYHKLSALAEEFAKLCRELGGDEVRSILEDLVSLAAVATAWAESLYLLDNAGPNLAQKLEFQSPLAYP